MMSWGFELIDIAKEKDASHAVMHKINVAHEFEIISLWDVHSGLNVVGISICKSNFIWDHRGTDCQMVLLFGIFKNAIFVVEFLCLHLKTWIKMKLLYSTKGNVYVRKKASTKGLVYHFTKVWWLRMFISWFHWNQGQTWPVKWPLKSK